MSALGQNQTFSRKHYNLPLESVVVHHNKVEPPMSALGQKRTSRHLQPMSALPPKADITERGWYVRYVPIADIMQRNKKGAQLVGGNLYRLRVPVKPVSISIDATKTAYFSPASRLEIS